MTSAFCVFLVLTLLATLGRASVISLAVACMISLLVFARTSWKILGTLIVVTAITAIGVWQIDTHAKKSLTIDNSRASYWQETVTSAWTNTKTIHLGTGLNTFALSPTSVIKQDATNYAHSFFFQMLSDTGIYGFILSLVLVGSVIWQSVRTTMHIKDKQQKLLYICFFTGILASVLNSLVDFDWQLPLVFLVFCTTAGILSKSSS